LISRNGSKPFPRREHRYQPAKEMPAALNRLREGGPRKICQKAISRISGGVLTASLLLCALAAFIGLKQMQETDNNLKC